MRKLLISFWVLIISGLANLALGQDFYSTNSMIGHRVYFKDLCDRADVYELLVPVVDGKHKPLKPKQQSEYPEIKDFKTIYQVNGIKSDKNGQYLDLSSGNRNYFLKIADLKTGAKYEFHNTAVNYDAYEQKLKEYDINYQYINSNCDKAFFKTVSSKLLLDVYAKVVWQSLSIGNDKEVYVTMSVDGAQNPLTMRMDGIKPMLLHNGQLKVYRLFESRVNNEYRPIYKHLDISRLNHEGIDSTKIVLKYFYPVQIARPSLNSDLKPVIVYELDGQEYLAQPEYIDSILVSDGRMTIYKNHFASCSAMRNQYHYFDISDLENLHIDNDSLLCEKFYPMTVLEADLNNDNDLIYRVMVGADKKGFKKSTFLIRAKTDNEMELEIKAYEERLEAERRAREERKADDEYFEKYLKGGMFYRQCTITQLLGNKGEAALIGMMFGIGYNNAIIVTEGYAFKDMYNGALLSQGDVDLQKVPRDVINKGGLGQVYQFAKAMDTTSEFTSTRDGNTIYVTIKDKTHTLVFDPKNRTITDGENVYKYRKFD